MRYVVYKSGLLKRQWRWRLVAGNGKIIANGGEGFHNRADCLNSINLVKGTRLTPVLVRGKESDS